MKESELKSAVAQYLQYGMNQGKWYSDRLNSGIMMADYNGARRAVHMCRNGTADFMVFQDCNKNDVPFAYAFKNVRLLFIELKTPKTKQNDDQLAFESEVKKHGAEYVVIRSLESLQEVLPL